MQLLNKTIYKPCRIGVLPALLLMLFVSLSAAAEDPLRVGIYQNYPSVFFDDDGRVRGFYIDVLEQVAEVEGWELQYVRDTWPGLIDQLKGGTIDMIAGMAYSTERDRLYDFTTEPVFINWGQVYVQDRRIQSILDLRDRRVVGLRQDIYTLSFQSLLQRFEVPVKLIEVDSYAEVLAQVEAGLADAGITSRTNGNLLEAEYSIHRSPIICCSREVHYAVLEGSNGDFLKGLDRQIRQLKADNNSVYYRLLDKWYSNGEQTRVPEWIIMLLVGTSLGAVLLFGGVLILRRQVRERTARLQEAHDFLESRVEQRTAELYEKNQQLLNEISDHRVTQKKLQHMVRHDPLTGLPNRRWFAEHLQEDIKRAKRNHRKLAVIFLDLDGFKETNDSYGHDLGDMVLVGASERIRDCLRATDKLARLGGDEFIVIVPEIRSVESVEVIADKILQRFQQPFEFEEQQCSISIGISLGISLFPEHGEEPEALLVHADSAMYDSKKAGRNRWSLYGTEPATDESTLLP